MTAKEIAKAIKGLGDLYIPEFTFRDLRIDAILIDIRKRWVRGFEIKLRREDYVQDKKWQLYSQFCSSLSIACPDELIKPHEVPSPFGLLWVNAAGEVWWKKRPKNIQTRNSLAWTWRYLEILEVEIKRLVHERAPVFERL